MVGADPTRRQVFGTGLEPRRPAMTAGPGQGHLTSEMI